MNKFIILILTITLLTSCSENSNSNSSGSKSSAQCDNMLLDAVNSGIENTKNLQIKWSDDDGQSCGVSFKVAEVDYQVDLEFDEMGTANNMKTVGITEMSHAELDFRVAESYKEHEGIANLGDKAVYYNQANNHQVYVLTGDNSFTVKTINWKTRGGDKDITVKVANMVVTLLKK